MVVKMAGFKSWPSHFRAGQIQTNDSTSLSPFHHPWKVTRRPAASNCRQDSANESAQCLA